MIDYDSYSASLTFRNQSQPCSLFHKARGCYVADVDEIRPQFSLDAPDANALFASSILRRNGMDIGSTIDDLDSQVSDIYGLHELALPMYSDQVLPFDVTLAGANEYGAMCAAKILGVEILNEGSGISVDDAVSEASATFVARAGESRQAVPGLFVLPGTTTLARTREGDGELSPLCLSVPTHFSRSVILQDVRPCTYGCKKSTSTYGTKPKYSGDIFGARTFRSEP